MSKRLHGDEQQEVAVRWYVTGIRRGIGRALALARAASGDAVAGNARHAAGLAELAAELRRRGAPQVHLAAASLTSESALEAWIDAALVAVGPPDVVVASAGVLGPRAPVSAIDPRAWREVMEVNLMGNVRLYRLLAARLAADHLCLWIALSSSVAFSGRGGWGPYAASKAALVNLWETLAEEHADDAWSFVTLNPGGTRTDMRREAYPEEDPRSLPGPEELAPVFAWLVERWYAGELTTGSHWHARELLSGLDRSPGR